MAVAITDKAQMREIMKNEAKALVVRFCQLNGYAVPKLSVENFVKSHVCLEELDISVYLHHVGSGRQQYGFSLAQCLCFSI